MTENNDAAKKKAADEKAAREKANHEHQERLAKMKPTPTQDENDRTARGEHLHEHTDDGSGPDPHATRHIEGKHPQGHSGSAGTYPTRESRPSAKNE